MISEMTYKDTIGLICCVWDDPRGIMRLLSQPTITDFDYLTFFDGKFCNWVGEPEWKSDEVKNIIEDWSNSTDTPVYYEWIDNKTEAQKRNQAFHRAYKLGMNWGLVVDSDEVPYIDKMAFDEEVYSLKMAEYGCYSVILDNYQLKQRRPRLFDMREQPIMIQDDSKISHSHIYSSMDGRDMAQDITVCKYDVISISLTHNKEYYSKYRFDMRNKYGAIKGH